MQIDNLLRDEDAVSPVIGVILMVAITVILAAVIGTFVLGLGDQVSSSAPQASFTFEYSDQSDGFLNVTHDGGDSIPASQLNVSASETILVDDPSTATSYGADPSGLAAGAGPLSSVSFADMGASGDIGAGDTVNVAGTAGDSLNDATVRIVWSASSGGSTATLAKWTGPDA